MAEREKSVVLAVDDDLGLLAALHRLLDREYEIVEASNPEDAIDVLHERRKIEAVVLDMEMPHRGFSELDPHAGVHVVRALRGGIDESGIDSGMVVIVLSAYPLPDRPVEVGDLLGAAGVFYVHKASQGWHNELHRKLELAIACHQAYWEHVLGITPRASSDLEEMKTRNMPSELQRIKRQLQRLLRDLERLCPEDDEA